MQLDWLPFMLPPLTLSASLRQSYLMSPIPRAHDNTVRIFLTLTSFILFFLPSRFSWELMADIGTLTALEFLPQYLFA